MEINLSKKSVISRLYRWYYPENSLPSSYCPYFWNMIIMFIMIIPITAYCLLASPIIRLVLEEKLYNHNPLERMAKATVVNILLIMPFSVLYGSIYGSFVGFYKESPNSLNFVIWLFGNAVITTLVLTTIVYLGLTAGERRNTRRREEWPIVTYLKAIKNKICPTINWKEDEQIL